MKWKNSGKMKKIVLWIVATVIVIVAIYLGISAYVTVEAISVQRKPITESPVGIDYENVSFPSRVDEMTLKGWYMPGGDSCIIIVTGGWDNRINENIRILEITGNLVSNGFSVLLFDKRGRGESDGKAMLLVHTAKDIGGALDYVRNRGHTTAYLLGYSAGAASSIMFAAENDITALVSDSSFADLDEMLVRGIVDRGYPEFFARVFSPGAFLVARIVYGYESVNPIEVVVDVSCPILFIHGEVDHFIPVNDVYRLYQASNNPFDEMWVVPDADHCQEYNTNPTGYIDRLIAFFDE